MKLKTIAKCAALGLALSVMPLQAQNKVNDSTKFFSLSRLTVGGYGEAVYTRNFYSDNMFRYSHAERYKDAKGHGRVDLPHVVVNLGYDFGKGWSMGSEIEFEHGGNEVAVEIEAEETGEFEHEIERGGEVALEQFWIQKSFGKGFNIRMGHIIVPVGQTNNAHLPTQFFTCYRPEGEFNILPCTWHETGISLWGRLGDWRYEAIVVPALNSDMFNNANWVKNGSASGYEFRVANHMAGALRIDNYSIRNFHWGVSGYIGNTFNNDIVTNEFSETSQYKDVKGTVVIGTAEFDYKANGLVVRGNFDYGHLGDANLISSWNKNQNHQSFSPYPRSLVGEAAITYGGELAYDIMYPMKNTGSQQLYLFGRYDYYDSYIPTANALTDYQWTDRHVMTFGVNYYPIKQVVIKAEYAKRFLKEQYNDEPMLSLGVAYSGFLQDDTRRETRDKIVSRPMSRSPASKKDKYQLTIKPEKMKKLFKSAALVAASVLLAVSLSSCNKDPQDVNEETNKATKEAIVKQYLNHTVYPTYASLATEAENLVENLEALKANKTQANVNTATASFIEARHWWELSEAFLFGAASDFGIDPHIDSWPLDEDAFNNLMGSPNMIAMLATDEDGTVAGEQLGNALLGFHGIEYILFRDGQPRNVNEINDDMMTYVVAVSRDLRNRCFQLEVSWNADAPQAHKELMEELELNTTVNGGDNTYGANMTQSGQAGSTFATFTNALEAIADGCLDIADEVGTSKIGKPHTGEDPTYVESPYSQKSIKDFYDNITSVKNAYMGGMEGQRDETLSLHTYIKDYNADLDNRVLNAIENALAKINAMKAPFVQFYADATAGEAMEACQELSDVMSEVKAEFSKIDNK